MASFTLTARAARLASNVVETFTKAGPRAAATLLLRSVWRKAPLLYKHVRVAGRARAISADVHARRAAMAETRPYVAVAITGGVGDFIVVARFVRDLLATGGDAVFDVFSTAPRRAAWIFAAVPGFNGSHHDILFHSLRAEYDLALQANQAVVAYRETMQAETLRHHPDLVQALQALFRSRAQLEVFIERHPYLDNFLARTATFAGYSRRDFLHHTAGLTYGGDALPVPVDPTIIERVGLRRGGYVTVHNGFDAEFIIAGQRATKCYPHFDRVVAILREAMPDVVFVQLGLAATSETLPACDVNLVGRTSLHDVAAVLSGARFHIDNEGGLVHLARCFGVRSAVVFGPTPSAFFAYPANLSIDPPVCGDCWWLSPTWMDRCTKGYATPRCMSEQDPAVVAVRILRWRETEDRPALVEAA